MWAKVRALEVIPDFQKLGDDMQQDHDDWLVWFNLEKPDQAPLPGEYGTVKRFHKLLVLRAMRPDRVPTELTR